MGRSCTVAVWAAMLSLGCGGSDDPRTDPSQTPDSRTVSAPVAGSAGNAVGVGSTGVMALPGSGGTASGSAVGSSAHAGTGGSAGSITMAAGSAAMPATTCATPEEESFSFFLISYEAIVRESGSEQGFGGNLGGIAGADALCLRAALSSSECAGTKTWHAFLSTTKQDAIDRIGHGPWHDRLGRVFANELADLIADRPSSADPAIINDLPNELGVPNHDPDGAGPVDNHQTLTGSGLDGKLYTQPPGSEMPMMMMGGPGPGRAGGPGGFGSSTSCDDTWTPEKATCWDWTVADPSGCPRVGHSWPRQGSGVNWISVWNESGCAAGATLSDSISPDGKSVGSFGGYGGFYCFAVVE